MRSLLVLAASLFAAMACTNVEQIPSKKVSHPSHKYSYIEVDTTQLAYKQTDYLPIYSDIYHSDGTKRFLLTSTVSLRNNTLTDTVFLLKADYNDSYGILLKHFVDSAVILLPLESIEFVVEETENEGGAGAHFIIEWGADRENQQMLIQGIMISTNYQQGISFVTDAKTIKRHYH
jgi:hypothetical protein